jgi:hypothetical protein
MEQLTVFSIPFLLAFVEVTNARVHTPKASQTTHLHSLTAVVLTLLLVSSCFPEMVNFRLPALHWNKNTPSGPTKQAPDPLAHSESLDIVLVASVDGKFHALNRTTGHTLIHRSRRWSPRATSTRTQISQTT